MSDLLPPALHSQKDLLFGNMPEIYQFHSRQDTHTHTHHKLFVPVCHSVLASSISLWESPFQGLPPGSSRLPGDAREGGVLLPAAGEENRRKRSKPRPLSPPHTRTTCPPKRAAPKSCDSVRMCVFTGRRRSSRSTSATARTSRAQSCCGDSAAIRPSFR